MAHDAATSQPELMKHQWNEMAKRNAFFSITSWPEFEDADRLDQQLFWENGRIHADNLLNRIGLRKTQDLEMVEIGCGMGRMTQRFAQRFRRVYALDISGEMIERAKEFWGHLDNVTFLENSGVDLRPLEIGSRRDPLSRPGRRPSRRHVPLPGSDRAPSPRLRGRLLGREKARPPGGPDPPDRGRRGMVPPGFSLVGERAGSDRPRPVRLVGGG